MTDPFAAALDALFSAPGSAAAVYTPAGGAAAPIRVIRSRLTDRIETGDWDTLADTNVVEIRRREAPAPRAGDLLVIGDESFLLQGGARLDVEGLTWKCGLVPA